MSIFCKFDEEDIQEIEMNEYKFQQGIQKLNANEKEQLLMHMYKMRHNLLVDLTEIHNKNTLLTIIMLGCVALTIFMKFQAERNSASH